MRHRGADLPPVRAIAAGRRRLLPRLDRHAAQSLDRRADLFLSRRAREPGRLRHVVVLLPERMDPARRRQGRDRGPRPAEETALRARARQFRPHVRHDHTHQQGRLSRPRDRGRQGRQIPHLRARRIPDIRPDLARRRATLARAASGAFRPRGVQPGGRDRQRGNRGLYARRQYRAHATRHPAAQAGPHSLDAWHERPVGARPQAAGGAEGARSPCARLGFARPRDADARTRGLRSAARTPRRFPRRRR